MIIRVLAAVLWLVAALGVYAQDQGVEARTVTLGIARNFQPPVPYFMDSAREGLNYISTVCGINWAGSTRPDILWGTINDGRYYALTYLGSKPGKGTTYFSIAPGPVSKLSPAGVRNLAVHEMGHVLLRSRDESAGYPLQQKWIIALQRQYGKPLGRGAEKLDIPHGTAPPTEGEPLVNPVTQLLLDTVTGFHAVPRADAEFAVRNRLIPRLPDYRQRSVLVRRIPVYRLPSLVPQ